MTLHRTNSWLLLILCLALACTMSAQLSPQPPPASAKKHSQTTANHASSTKSPAQFVDITSAAGIDFHLTCGDLDSRYIIDSMCGGVAVFDYDNDGWMDLFFVDGSTLDDLRAGRCHTGKLYRNNHDGTFTDVTAKSGIAHCGWGYGIAVGDYDNDGWDDLYITYLDGGILYHNNHDGTFTD